MLLRGDTVELRVSSLDKNCAFQLSEEGTAESHRSLWGKVVGEDSPPREEDKHLLSTLEGFQRTLIGQSHASTQPDSVPCVQESRRRFNRTAVSAHYSKGRIMEHCDAREGPRSSWEDVLEMPDKADAAQLECQQKQEASEAATPKIKQEGQSWMLYSPGPQSLPIGSG